jgi:hypothetical protein
VRPLLGAFFFFALFLACSAPEPADVRPHQASSSSKKSHADDDDDDTAPVATTVATAGPAPPAQHVDAGSGGTATTYVGTLDSTPTVRFGGSPYCFYDVTLKQVEIEVAALPNGDVIGAQVTDTMVEASVPPCTYSPSPPSAQSFSFTTSKPTADGFELSFNGAAQNQPATKLVVGLKKVGSSYEAAANWHRTDQPAPLDWTATTKITLGPR